MQVLTVNGAQFRFETPGDLATAKTQLASTMRAGGGFVDFTTTAQVRVAVLVTPQSAVLVEDSRALSDYITGDDSWDDADSNWFYEL